MLLRAAFVATPPGRRIRKSASRIRRRLLNERKSGKWRSSSSLNRPGSDATSDASWSSSSFVIRLWSESVERARSSSRDSEAVACAQTRDSVVALDAFREDRTLREEELASGLGRDGRVAFEGYGELEYLLGGRGDQVSVRFAGERSADAP